MPEIHAARTGATTVGSYDSFDGVAEVEPLCPRRFLQAFRALLVFFALQGFFVGSEDVTVVVD